MTTLVLVGLAGFAAGVVVSQAALVALVLVGRRALLRRARRRPHEPRAYGRRDEVFGLADDPPAP